MNESLKNTYNITMKVPVGSGGSAIGAEQLTFMVMSPTGDMSVYCGGARSAPPFLPGKGSCFWESGRKSIGSEKVSGSIGLLMEVLYVGISCSVDIWCTDEYSRRF